MHIQGTGLWGKDASVSELPFGCLNFHVLPLGGCQRQIASAPLASDRSSAYATRSISALSRRVLNRRYLPAARSTDQHALDVAEP